ncbi:MAG: SIMPL domain-containing protein [Alphaproteobacteria bacterium]|nr:SIMPL domain-containing protein [Alphaproteobacteria bacterium]
MKPVILGAVIALLSAVAVVRLPAMSGVANAPRTISVTGQANKKILPDEAHLRVNLNAMNLNMAEAKAAHDEKLGTLFEIAKSEGVEEKKLRTESASVQPVYEYVTPPVTATMPNPQPTRVFRGYRMQTQLDITVVDTAKVGALMEKITEAGFEKEANTEWGNLLDLHYEVSEPEKKRDELLAEAIAAARAKAEHMAEAAGAGVVRVQHISEGMVSPYNPPRPMPMMAMTKMGVAEAQGSAVTPPPGEQDLQANVSVIFELN